MSTPQEKTRAVLETEKFLLALSHEGEIKRIPKDVRELARRLLRHYPTRTDLHFVAKSPRHIFRDPYIAMWEEQVSRKSKNTPIQDAAIKNLPPCQACGSLQGDPCRTPNYKSRWPHRGREKVDEK